MDSDQQRVRDLAFTLMDTLGRAIIGRSLRHSGWTIRFDNGKRRIGACWPATKMISLSRHHTNYGGLSRMDDAIRHEIAHAIDIERRGRTDHGPEWRRLAIACGATPESRFDLLPHKINARYRLRCPGCERTDYLFNRPRARHACPFCSEGSCLSLMEVLDQKTGVVLVRAAVFLKHGH